MTYDLGRTSLYYGGLTAHGCIVFKRLKNGPVILANRSQPAAVLVSPEWWNAIAEHTDDLECGIEALKVELAIAKGKEAQERLTLSEIGEWLGDESQPD